MAQADATKQDDQVRAGALLVETLSYARHREYTGWDYFDGMSSRLLDVLPVENKWSNIAVQETVKRAPINLRPLFRVQQHQSYKGSALFAMANLVAAEVTGDVRYEDEARALLDWLIDNRARGYAGFCGGHQHPIQDLRGRLPAGHPGIVSTAYAVQALLAGASLDSAYPDCAHTAWRFIVEDLGYEEVATGARVKYHPGDSADAYVINANAIAARTLLELADGETRQVARAEAILDYVASTQNERGGWKYMDPSTASHLSMDNHHNGFIVESFLRHRHLTDSSRYDDVIDTGVEFYRNELFEPSGAPRWDESSRFPRDIHAATQGIIVFTLAGDRAFARRILDWTCRTLYAGDGRFMYQRRRFYTKRFTLMRWCQAWMAYALAVYLVEEPIVDAMRSRSLADSAVVHR